MKFATSHLRSKYFTAELFHLAKPNFTRRRRISLKKDQLTSELVFFSVCYDLNRCQSFFPYLFRNSDWFKRSNKCYYRHNSNRSRLLFNATILIKKIDIQATYYTSVSECYVISGTRVVPIGKRYAVKGFVYHVNYGLTNRIEIFPVSPYAS